MNIARVLFDPELLLRLARGRYEVVENALPVDTQLRGVTYDCERGAVSLMVEHPSFPAVPTGGILPILPTPVVRTLLDGKIEPANSPTSWVDWAAQRQAQFEKDGWPIDIDNDCAP